MKTAFVLLALAYTMAVVSGAVCLSDYCEQHPCNSTVTENSCGPGTVYRPNSTYCGCCPACLTELDDGAACVNFSGMPPSAICRNSSNCHNGVCTAV